MINVIETKISAVVEKLRQVEIDISVKEGDFNLFALIEREDSLGKWDIVVSAKWIGENRKNIINEIAQQISIKLSKNEQLMLSRIVTLLPSDTFVKSLNMIGVEHGSIKMSNNTFSGVTLKEAYLITSKSN